MAKCYRCGKEAVVKVNGRWLMCEKCQLEFSVEVLNSGKPLVIAIQGEPQALLIPQKGESEWN